MLESKVQGLARIIHSGTGIIAFDLPNLVTDLLGIGHVTVCGIKNKHKIRGEGRYKPELGAEREE